MPQFIDLFTYFCTFFSCCFLSLFVCVFLSTFCSSFFAFLSSFLTFFSALLQHTSSAFRSLRKQGVSPLKKQSCHHSIFTYAGNKHLKDDVFLIPKRTGFQNDSVLQLRETADICNPHTMEMARFWMMRMFGRRLRNLGSKQPCRMSDVPLKKPAQASLWYGTEPFLLGPRIDCRLHGSLATSRRMQPSASISRPQKGRC